MKYKYNWDEFPEIKEYLERVYENTINELKKISQEDMEALKFINYLEDYLKIIINYKYDINKVLDSLLPIKYISFKESLLIDRNTNTKVQGYPPYMDFGNRIFLDSGIESPLMQRFYLYSALTSRVLNFKTEETYNFSKMYTDSIDPSNRTKVSLLVQSGWLLLEQSLVYEVARNFIFTTTGIDYNPEIPNENKQLLLSFGMTLDNIGSKDCHDAFKIIYDLKKKAFNGNFSSEVIKEYFDKENEYKLFEMLYLMGLIINNEIKLFPNIVLKEKEILEIRKGLFKSLYSLYNLNENNKNYGDISLEGKLLPYDNNNKLLKLVNKNLSDK